MSGSVLFSLETASLRLCVEAAIRSGANLRSADLSYADLRYANLRSADLRSADLRSADLRSADLRSADLSYADLRYANLRSADLRSADLSYADLRYANLRSAVGVNKHICTPLLMLLDQPGKIRAYKMVDENNVGPFNGGITYLVGKKYSVDNANTDGGEQCGAGINLATLDWCLREWKVGYKVLIAEFTAKDIACVPTATNGKFRVHRCKIVGEKDISESIKGLV